MTEDLKQKPNRELSLEELFKKNQNKATIYYLLEVSPSEYLRSIEGDISKYYFSQIWSFMKGNELGALIKETECSLLESAIKLGAEVVVNAKTLFPNINENWNASYSSWVYISGTALIPKGEDFEKTPKGDK